MFRILYLFTSCIFIQWVVYKCEMALFVKQINSTKYEFSCVATGDSLKYALTWLPKNLERDVQKRSTYTHNTEITGINLTNHGNSLNFHMPPVLDYRWESFPTIMFKGKMSIITNHTGTVSSINLSILFRNSSTLILLTPQTKLCATILEEDRQKWQNGNNVIIQFKECQLEHLNDTSNEISYATWMHVTIFKKDGIFYLGEFEQELYETFIISDLQVVGPIGQVKLHTYTVYSGKPNNIQTCLSFHVLTSGNCARLAEKGEMKWIQLKTIDKNIDFDAIENCLISGIRRCNQTETRVMHLESSDTKVACASLKKDTHSLYYDMPEYFTNNRSSLSMYINGSSDYVTCSLRGECFCLGDKTGKFCEIDSRKVRNLSASMYSTNSLIVRWKSPQKHQNEVDIYKVECTRISNDQREERNDTYKCSLWKDYICIEFKGVIQNERYNIMVSTKLKGVEGFGLPENYSIIPKETFPEHPKNLTGKVINCTLVLRWNNPETINGQLNRFVITILGTLRNYTISFNFTEYQTAYNYTTSDIKLGHYNISIQAENPKGKSNPSNIVGIDVEQCNTEGEDKYSWIKRNILYFYLIGAAAGLVFLGTCCWLICSQRRAIRSKPKNLECEDSVPLYQCNSVILNRRDISNVLKLWVQNNVDDTHIQNEFNNVDGKIRHIYDSIVAKDFCRVKVKDLTKYAEANAHFVQGCKGDKTYIAMQRPKNNTMGDAFWMIVWDEKVSIIVSLLTKEESEEKPYDYWTDNNWNAINVKLNFTRYHCDFVMRNLTITRLEDTRKIILFNYFSWPHNEIPVNPLSFVNFLKFVKCRDIDPTPMLVHCSEGFGRTGSYIMCDYFINTADDILNVSKYLEVINKCRPYLVKNFLQYKFVYFVIDELNANRQTELSTATFLYRCTDIMETTLPSDVAYIKTRRYVYKLLYSDEEPTNDNSNFTMVPGYQNENTYYVTKQPFFDNVHLLWEFVYSQKIRHILILQNLRQVNGKFWPSQGESLEFETLQVRIINYSRDKSTKMYRVEVQRKHDKSIEVVLLHFKHWDLSQRVPGSLKEFYDFYKMYNTIKSPRDNKTVVCCHNGATASGLFICFDLVFKKWKSEDVFDLVWAVLSIKHRQEYFMDRLEQHQFIYKLFEYFLTDVENYTTYNEYNSMSHTCPTEYDSIDGNCL